MESPWLGNAEELTALQLSPPVPKQLQEHTLDPSDYKGLLRKTTCSSFGMGMKVRDKHSYSHHSAFLACPEGIHQGVICNFLMLQFRTEEVQRCLEAQSGLSYKVEVCVATTATYGDKFRGVCKHRYDCCSWALVCRGAGRVCP